MTPLRQALVDYLRIRRQLGFKLVSDQRHLENFVAFLERAGAERITVELAVDVGQAARAMPIRTGGASGSGSCAASRAIWRRSTPQARCHPSTCCPPTARVSRHTFTAPAEIRALMAAARALTPRCARRHTRRVIGLMAATGLRLGEALGLDRADVDLDDGALHVRAPSRPSSARCRCTPPRPRRCASYARLRDRPARAADGGVLHHQAGASAHPPGVLRDVPEADRVKRASTGAASAATAAPTRSQTHVCCAHAAGLAPGRRGDRHGGCRCSPPISGISHPESTLLVLAGGAGAARARRPRPRRRDRRPAMTLHRAHPRGVLHRPSDDPARTLAPATIAAYRDTFRLLLRFAQTKTGKQPSQARLRRPRRAADRRVPRPPRAATAATPPAPATRGSQRSTRSTGTPRCDTPSTPPRIARVIEIPAKRHERATISYLDVERDRSAARRARPHHLARPPRPRDAAHRDPDRATRLRTRRPAHPGRHAHHRRAHPVEGKGRKERSVTLTRRDRRGPTRVARERQGNP